MNTDYTPKSIGARRLTWFPIESETESETTYGTPIRLARIISLDIAPTTASTELESDDAVEDDIVMLSGVEVSININQLTDTVRAALLGHTLDADGGIITSADDVAPYGALAWEEQLSRKAGGKILYKRVLLYRGRFQEYAEKAETKKRRGLTLQTPTITGTFLPRLHDNNIKYSMRQDTPDYSTTKFEAWFTTPQETTASVASE